MIWFGFFLLLLVVWWKLQGLKRIAFERARRHCDEMDVQFLDQSVVLCKLRLKRDRDGLMKLCCFYEFEFSTAGDARYIGSLVLLGGKMLRIELEPHRL